MKTIEAEVYPDPTGLEAKIKRILATGKIVRFRNKINGITKDINEWNPDKMRDLKAFRHTGSVPWVCWDSPQYEIEEIEK
jgi:hypothetical protein